MRTKITDNCPEEAEESDEELIEDDETPVDDEDDSTDVGESSGAGVGRRGASLMTMGSFTMMSTNAGGNQEELGEDDEDEEETAQDWDITGDGKCGSHQAWLAMDTKCDAKCFHEGNPVDESVDAAVCSKICQVPGNNGAKCNVIKTVQPTDDGMYLTRSKVMEADLKDPANADPMACAIGR